MAPSGTGKGDGLEGSGVTAPTPPLDTAKLLAAALFYASLGRKVFPLQWPVDGKCSCKDGAKCGTPAKHPRTENGLKDATTDQAVIKKWWRRWPRANVAICMGDNLVTIDVDSRKGGDESIRDL